VRVLDDREERLYGGLDEEGGERTEWRRGERMKDRFACCRMAKDDK